MSENKNVAEMHGCIVCAKTFSVLAIAAGIFILLTVRSIATRSFNQVASKSSFKAGQGVLYENSSRLHLTLRPYERGIQETLGRYNRFVMPGLGFQFPIIHIIRIRDVREHIMEIHPQAVITKDNVEIMVNGIM